MARTNEQIQAKNLQTAQKQVDQWDKLIAANQEHLADLKSKVDAALRKGEELANAKAVAEEYLLDLQEAEID